MLRVLIVDDEAPARDRLRKLLDPQVESGRLELVGEANDGPAAVKILASGAVDLLFLDVCMPQMDGFGVLERLPPESDLSVVFTTAFDEFAVRAFEVNAVDFLLKPIGRERLEEALERAERAHKTPETRKDNLDRLAQLLDYVEAQDAPAPGAPAQEAASYLERISIPYRDRILIISIDRLVSAEIAEGITRLFVVADQQTGPRPRLRQHVVNYTLEQLEASLDPAAFMRVHRSCIVRLASIKEMIPWFSGRYKLLLDHGHEVIASRERSRLLKDRLLL